MFLLSFLACEAFYIGVEEEIIEDITEEVSPPLQIDIDWDEDMLRIKASNVEGYGNIEFGLIESSDECEADLLDGCWTGEDCYNGYLAPEGLEGLSRYKACHAIPNTDSEFGDTYFISSLRYSSETENVLTLDDAIENTNVPVGNGNTAFPAPSEDYSYETRVTYYIKAEMIGEEGENPERCWTWGVNPSYFDALECNTPLPASLDDDLHISLELE